MLREILVCGLREYLAADPHRTARHAAGEVEDRVPDGRPRHPSRRGCLGPVLHLPFLPVSAIGEAMLWAAAALTLWTGWDYLTAGLRHASGPRASGLPKSQLPSS